MNAIITGSLSQIAQQNNVSIAESFLNCDVIILADVSGSMGANDSRGNKSRYDVLREELANLQATLPGKIAVIAFDDDVKFCPGGVPFFEGGGTDLAGALKFAKVADVPDMAFVIISDGNPDSPQEALRIASTYKAKLSTIFVGPENDYDGGRKFLEQLARASGGQAVTADRAKELNATISRLLLKA